MLFRRSFKLFTALQLTMMVSKVDLDQDRFLVKVKYWQSSDNHQVLDWYLMRQEFFVDYINTSFWPIKIYVDAESIFLEIDQ
jgi:hypothetical protein